MIRPSSRIAYNFWAGFIAHTAFSLLLQDWHGKEAYIEIMNAYWVDIHWAVWIPIILFCFMYKIGSEVRADKEYRPAVPLEEIEDA